MKLRIDENAISDLRKFVGEGDFDTVSDKKIGYYPVSRYDGRRRIRGDFQPLTDEKSPTQKQALINWFSNVLRNEFDINAEDASLERIEKPRTADAAKKSPNILIGIGSMTGNAMILGRGQFLAYYRGRLGMGSRNNDNKVIDPAPDYKFNYPRLSYREQFDWMDKWYKIVIPDSPDYMTRSEIRKANSRGGKNTMVKPDDYSFDMYSGQSKYLPKSRRIFRDEIKLYNPDYARGELQSRLEDKRLFNRVASVFEDLEAINNRIRSIDFGNPILDEPAFTQNDISRLRNEYSWYTRQIKRLQDAVDSGASISRYTIESAEDGRASVDNILTSVFGV